MTYPWRYRHCSDFISHTLSGTPCSWLQLRSNDLKLVWNELGNNKIWASSWSSPMKKLLVTGVSFVGVDALSDDDVDDAILRVNRKEMIYYHMNFKEKMPVIWIHKYVHIQHKHIHTSGFNTVPLQDHSAFGNKQHTKFKYFNISQLSSLHTCLKAGEVWDASWTWRQMWMSGW